jgi:hypothetical protein
VTIILLAHAASTLFLVGLIWLIQVVHYPLMTWVSDSGFAAFERQHMRRTSWVVGGPMLVEAATATALVWQAPSPLTIAGAALLAIIWISTWRVQVPLHEHLTRGRDLEAIDALVRGNWIRTLAWSARGGLALSLLAQ